MLLDIPSPPDHSLPVATLVWQGWQAPEIAAHLKISLEDLQRDYANELQNGVRIIEGRVITETMKRALSGDEKTLHLLLKSKFGYIDKPSDQVNLLNAVIAPEQKTVFQGILEALDKNAPMVDAPPLPTPPKPAKKPSKPS